jgi:hypothetical protein
MANKFTLIQTGKSRYLEAENKLAALTMITGPEALTLAKAGQELTGTDEDLIYFYRDDFLHIQRAAENGLTALDMLVENPNEFAIVATAWGFVCRVQSKFNVSFVYTRGLAEAEINREQSNVTVDWSRPLKPTIDVDYYRNSGNAVLLEDSTLSIPLISNVDLVKQRLGIEGRDSNTIIIDYKYIVRYEYTKGLQKLRPLPGGNGVVIPVSITQNERYQITEFPVVVGSGYQVGETITVYGKDLGGTSANNAVFTVKQVDNFGGITNISVEGTASSTGGRSIILIKMTGQSSASIIIREQFFG